MTQYNFTSTTPAPQAAGPANTLRLTVSGEGGNSSALVTIHPPSQPGDAGTPPQRAPVDLCCVVDISGSMADDAAVPSEQDKPREMTGLSVMDVTKHAMKTIISSMDKKDRLALVSFTDTAKVVCPLTQTTEGGKKVLLKAVETLQPDDCTNLWDGLKVGMNTLNDQKEVANYNIAHRVQSLFILTDGMPNVVPPRGHIPMFKQYLEAHPQTRFNVSTFGFGYSLDSKLLSEIADVGGGSYGFIPDAGMVGTVFVHALANLFSTYAPRAVLNVEVPDGMTVKAPRGSYHATSTSWGSCIEIGDIQYGQTRDFILEFEGVGPDGKEVTVSLASKPWYTTEKEIVTQSLSVSADQGPVPDDLLATRYRLDLVTYIYQLCAQYGKEIDGSDAPKYFKETAEEINRLLPNHADAVGLATDMAGELHLAVSSQAHWRKWGIHYFPSLARAHQRQQGSNFKDAGLQVYGRQSPLFLKARDAVDATFDNLPPPKPSKKVIPQAPTKYARGVVHQALHTMQQYNSKSAPCMTGDSPVTLADGTEIRTDAVKRGAVVATPRGPRTIAAVIKTALSGPVPLCTIGKLRITPWHPIRHEGTWTFPADVVSPQSGHVPAVYSFLLQPSEDTDAHAMYIGGIACVTFGHGIVEDGGHKDARAHAFFGSYEKVLTATALLPGFYEEDGVALCGGVVRDTDTRIRGLLPLEQTMETRLYDKLSVKTTA